MGMRKLSGGGRGLLVLGAALVLVSVLGYAFYQSSTFFTWFTISGNRTNLPAGSYNGIETTQLLNNVLTVPIAWLALAWLFVCATAAIAVAGMGRPTHNFGLSALLILLLYVALLFLDANVLNQQTSAGTASISLGYGFVVAAIACILIEAGGRLPSAVPTRRRVPTMAPDREKAE
jgi:hypothetical protein